MMRTYDNVVCDLVFVGLVCLHFVCVCVLTGSSSRWNRRWTTPVEGRAHRQQDLLSFQTFISATEDEITAWKIETLSQARKTWGCEKKYGATDMFWVNGIKSKVIKRNSDITFQPSLGRHYTSWKWWSHKQALHVVKQTCSWWNRRVLKIPTRKANFNQNNICSPISFPSQLQIKEVGHFPRSILARKSLTRKSAFEECC